MKKILKNDPLILSLAIFVIGCLGVVLVLFFVSELNIEKENKYVENTSIAKRKDIAAFLNNNILSCKSLAENIEYELISNNRIDQEQFNTFASRILNRGTTKIAATYTTNDTVELIYPLAQNIGLHKTDVIANIKKYKDRLEKNEVFVEGPTKILNNVEVIIIHSPVVPSHNAVQIVSTFIGWSELVKRNMIKDTNSVVHTLINHKGEIIIGDPDYYKKKPRIDTVKFSYSINEWLLATYPEKGWTRGYSLSQILLSLAVVALFSLCIYFIWRNKLDKIAKINALYRIFSENTGDALWTLDTKTMRVVFIGKNNLNIRGIRSNQAQYLRNFVPHEHFDSFVTTVNQAIEKYKTGETDTVNILFEAQIYNTKGGLFWAEVSATALPTNIVNVGRDVRELIGVTRNINQRKEMELEIKESEQKYKLLAENIKDVIFTMDLQTFRYKFITNTAYEMTGFNPEEYMNMTAREVFPREFFENIKDTVDAELEKYDAGETNFPHFRLEVQQYHKDGFIVWIEMTARIISTVSENLDTILVVSRNINERKSFESALQESELKHRLIVENIKDVICTMDVSISNFLFVSGACLETFGFTRAEFLQTPVYKTMPEHYYELLSQQLQAETMKYLRGEITNVKFVLELEQYHKNNSLVWVELSAKMVTSENGYLDKIVVIIRDISDRKAYEIALQESERKHKLITENTADSIWTMDPYTFKYNYLSPATIHITGNTREEVYASNRTIFEVLVKEDSDKIKKQLEKAIQLFLSGEKPDIKIIYEAQVRHKGGYNVWVETSLASIVDEQNQLVEIIGVTRRIDERKEMYFQIENQQRNLELLNSTKDKFFTIISHDLKNPFAALLNMSELLVTSYRGMNYQTLGEVIQVISKSTKYVYDLLENLLKWSRSSMGTMSYYPQKNDLIKLILETVIILKPQADAKNISIDININDTKYAFFDTNMIETVIRNLITNAIKFSPDNSVIAVRVEDYKKDADKYIVSVADEGVGISKDRMDKLFKIGEKNISTKGTKNEMGTGLGLILCKEFMDKHGCDIYAESGINNKGTTFCFTVRKKSLFDGDDIEWVPNLYSENNVSNKNNNSNRQ